MAKTYKYIINIGSSSVSLSVIILENGNFGRCFFNEYRHDGINNNFFINPEKLFAVIKSLIEECTNTLNREISKAYLILPQRFFRFRHGARKMIIKNGLVNKFDVAEITNNSLMEIEDCHVLECVPIAFRIKDDYVDNPIGQECDSMEEISVSVGILNRIDEFFEDLSKRFNIVFEYVPTLKPILNKLQNELSTNRSSRILLFFNEDFIDVCYCEMRTVIAEKIIEIGNIDFISALAEVGNTDIATAKDLLSHINFNIQNGSYAVGKGKVSTFDVEQMNLVVKKIYDYISLEIKKALDSMIGDSIIPIYMVGSSACEIRGADNLLTEKLGMPVSLLEPNLLVWNSSADYGIVGLVESFR